MNDPRPLVEPSEVCSAQKRLREYLSVTPLLPARRLGKFAGGKYWHKLESVLPTGSFKARGAFNAMLDTPAECKLITASSGNHAAACAYAANILGRRIHVVVPETTPKSKLQPIEDLGARLILTGRIYDEAEDAAVELARNRDMCYLSSFSDRRVASGGGTIALELLEQLPDLGTAVVPVGGGGLIAGIACALKHVDPGICVIGVQPRASAPMYHSVRAGRLVKVRHKPTLSDATAGAITRQTLRMALRYVDAVVTVTEEEIAASVTHLLLEDKLVAEGAGALPTAAVLAGHIPAPTTSRPAALILSGCNIDARHIGEIIG